VVARVAALQQMQFQERLTQVARVVELEIAVMPLVLVALEL
jgi:hypothetical protein